jgi:(p)ppGpp synthase/HD superfamily hydrolase
MKASPLYQPLVVHALERAAMWHVGQVRKNPSEQIPYIAHPAAVGFMLQRAGYDDETVAAGILHDVVEDCAISAEQIALEMTQRVAELVLAVTELPKKVGWEERKAAYRIALDQAPLEALAIAAADHISNNQSIVDMAKTSSDIWSLFHADKAQKLAHEGHVLSIIARRLDGPLVEELRHSIEVLRQLPG